MTKKALLLIDIQNDFLPNGALAVNNGNEIIPIVNNLLLLPFDLIAATKDWHPKDHLSFANNHKKTPGEKIMLGDIEQILWPSHCIQYTHGAEFPQCLSSAKISNIFYKGTETTIDSYSAFFDNRHHKSTNLAKFLKIHAINEIYIAGLATDYCVKFSVLDALDLEFNVVVVTDACRGVNLQGNDCEQALKEMQDAGAVLKTSFEILQNF